MWLLELSVKAAIEQAQTTGTVPTAEQQAQYEATRISALSDGTSRLLTIAGDTAAISVQGILTKTPSFLAMLFGGGNTTYTEIVSALAEADSNPGVAKAILEVDSPGGNIDGLFEALDAIKNFGKPLKAVISNVGASAAYAIASQADEIVAFNNAARIGSIGILASFRIDENRVDIASTKAPKKAPDVSTPEGQAVIREELDAIHNLFVGAIARGRDMSAKDINANFGQGATLLAGEALKRGMIDGISKTALTVVNSANSQTAVDGGDKKKVRAMDLNELQAKYPDLYKAAVQTGTDGERDRVTAHLTMGESSGAMDVAIAAIKDGEGLTATINAKYLSAGMNRADVNARADDDNEAGDATENAGDGGDGAQANKKTDAELVATEVEKQLGINAA